MSGQTCTATELSFPLCSYQFVNRQARQMFLPTTSISSLYEGFKEGRIMRITKAGPLGLCTPEITNAPNTFTRHCEHAAKLLNRPFVGYSKCLEICITQTFLCKQETLNVRSERKWHDEIYLQLLSGKLDLHLIRMFSWDQNLFMSEFSFQEDVELLWSVTGTAKLPLAFRKPMIYWMIQMADFIYCFYPYSFCRS